MASGIRLSETEEERIKASIKRFADETFDEEIGDLKACEFLRFCLQEIGPAIYNRAVADAQAQMQERVADLEGTCHQPQRSYWDDGSSGISAKVIGSAACGTGLRAA